VGYEKKETAKTAVTSTVKTDGKYAKYTRLYITSQGEAKNIQIQVNVTDPAGGTNTSGINYLRVGLLPIGKSSQFASEAFTASENGSKPIIFSDFQKNDRSKTGDWTLANKDAANPSENEKGTFGTAYVLGNAKADAVYGYEVFVYYEGTDFDCKDKAAGTDLNVDFVVNEVPASP
jgi:hypothetical protein